MKLINAMSKVKVVALAIAIGVGAGFAAGGAFAGPLPPQQPALSAPAVFSGGVAGAIDQVAWRTSNAPSTKTFAAGNTYENLPGAYQSIFVPPNKRALIIARFTAESRCNTVKNPDPTPSWCLLRMMIGPGAGVEMNPQASAQPDSFSFDSPDRGTESDASWEGHAADRSYIVSGGPNGTTYVVRVQWAVTNTNLQYWLDDWHLTVERALLP